MRPWSKWCETGTLTGEIKLEAKLDRYARAAVEWAPWPS